MQDLSVEDIEFDPAFLEFAGRMFDLARSGATAELAAYVAQGVSADLTNGRGDSLLMLAAYHGHAELAEALLRLGADANRVNQQGQTPLAGAVFRAEDEVVRVLLDGGADPLAGNPSALATARMLGREDLLAASA